MDNYKVQNIELIRTAIQKRVNEGFKRFAILPMGFWGKETKSLLEKEFQIKPKVYFDTFPSNEQEICPINDINTTDLSDTVLLIVIEKEDQRAYLYQQIVPFVSDSLIELVPLCNEEQKKIFAQSEKVSLDFLCVGFHKCGTTSLQAALGKNKNIFLPDVKETFFMMSLEEKRHRMLKQSYPIDKLKKTEMLKGGIEPIYPIYAASVYQYFGKDLKILFLVRNPIEALKSALKMSMREIDEIGFNVIKKYKKICPDLIKEYIKTNYKRFVYIDFIRLYERFYPKAQIKIVITEELIQNPIEEMEAIQKFIGLPEESRLKYDTFPHENKGDTIFKNLGGAYVNHALNQLRMQMDDVSLYLQVNEIRKKTFALTTTEFNFDQYEDIWEDAYYYYSDSIAALEERIGRSLKGVW